MTTISSIVTGNTHRDRDSLPDERGDVPGWVSSLS